MNRINFALAIHFHQPIGNFDNVIERAYRRCYKPFIELLHKHSDIKMTFHFSGCLLDYLEKKHPDILDMVKDMVRRKQIEAMGGGYYEPILTAIPEHDLYGQINMMTSKIKSRFGCNVKGIWTAERVWEPYLASSLSRSGIKYTILDDEHLLRSGVSKDNMHGYFNSEDNGNRIAVFPSDKTLRYLIPFKPADEAIKFLLESADRAPGALLTYGDDGEKFGEWPGTHDWVFKDRWLEQFFEKLTEHKKRIKLIHPSGWLTRNKPNKTLKIRPGSYTEMMKWSGGSWKNFLVKYPESNQMHKKMLYVSGRLFSCEKKYKASNPGQIDLARQHLYKGQCNCAYWHGVFGGLYLYHLRKAIYQELIACQKILDSLEHTDKKDWLSISERELYHDNKKTYILDNKGIFLSVCPYDGGVIKELDYKPANTNLLNTLSRKKESYHDKIVNAPRTDPSEGVQTIHDDFRTSDAALIESLVYDKFGRHSLRTYIFDHEISFDEFKSGGYKEMDSFSTCEYTVDSDKTGIKLSAASSLNGNLLTHTKEIALVSAGEMMFSNMISSNKRIPRKLCLGVEFNITMPELDSGRYTYAFDSEDSHETLDKEIYSLPLSSFGIRDKNKQLSLRFEFPANQARVFCMPVKTVSQSERSYELNYQCSSVLIIWDILPKGRNISGWNICLKFIKGSSYGPYNQEK